VELRVVREVLATGLGLGSTRDVDFVVDFFVVVFLEISFNGIGSSEVGIVSWNRLGLLPIFAS
jgi:hypothetical protein